MLFYLPVGKRAVTFSCAYVMRGEDCVVEARERERCDGRRTQSAQWMGDFVTVAFSFGRFFLDSLPGKNVYPASL